MEDFAEYILSEKDLASKMEIVYYLSKKTNIFFDKSVIFKTEIARMFLNYAKIEVDKNVVITACLLCNCKKIENSKNVDIIRLYAKEGSIYLRGMGFNKRFGKICEELNRYSNSNPRERESDILELVDQFGGMLLDRPERIGFKPDEALVLLEHRNLKDEYNRYLGSFIEFVNVIENIKVHNNMSLLTKLKKLYNETDELTKFIQKVVYEYKPKVDKMIQNHTDNISEGMFSNIDNPNRPLFSEETARKIMGHMNNTNAVDTKIDIK